MLQGVPPFRAIPNAQSYSIILFKTYEFIDRKPSPVKSIVMLQKFAFPHGRGRKFLQDVETLPARWSIDHSGKAQALPHSLRCDINIMLHSERAGSSRRKCKNILKSILNSCGVRAHTILSSSFFSVLIN